MKKILIVTTHIDIEQRLQKMLDNKILPEAEYSVVVEFFEATPQISTAFKNLFPISNISNREEISSAIKKCEEWGPFDYVLQTDEYSVYLAAEICEHLNFPGLNKKDVRKFRDKVEMKKALKGKVRAPLIYKRQELINNTNLFPVVVKPRSSAGSKGVRKLYSLHELEVYTQEFNIRLEDEVEDFHEFARDEIQFEELIQGSIFHIDGFIVNKGISFCRTSEYLGTCLDFLKGEPIGSFSVDDEDEQRLWHSFAQQVHDVMQIPDGAFHLEAFLTTENERIFLEIGIRPGGGLIVQTVQHATGVNLDEAHLQCQLGIIPKINRGMEKKYGFLTYPKKFNVESDQRIKEVCLPKSPLPSLIWSELPEITQAFTGSFSYTNSLGNFIFVSEDGSQIYRDINILLNEYSVK